MYYDDVTATMKRTQPNYAKDIQKNDARVYLMQVNQIPVKCNVIATLTLCVLLICLSTCLLMMGVIFSSYLNAIFM